MAAADQGAEGLHPARAQLVLNPEMQVAVTAAWVVSRAQSATAKWRSTGIQLLSG